MNKVDIRFSADIKNIAFARVSVASFILSLNPTLEQIQDIKTIVSEALSNAIIHGYNCDSSKDVYLKVTILKPDEIEIIVQDYGKGIEDIEQARQVCYTSRPSEEHSGMGFTIMEAFCDFIDVHSVVNLGTKVIIKKTLSPILQEVKG